MSVNEETQTVDNQEEVNDVIVEEVEQIPTEDNQESQTSEKSTDETHEDITYSFDDGDTPPQDNEESKEAPEWVKDLRKTQRETAKENKRLQKELEELKKSRESQGEEIQLGARPKLQDFDYDEDAHEKAIDDWIEQKAKYENQKKAKELEQAEKQKRFTNKVESYNLKREDFIQRSPDYADAEKEVEASLDATKLEIAMSTLEKPNDFVYALGKNPKILDELSSEKVDTTDIHSVIEFAGKIARLEAKMKEVRTPRRPATTPEKRVVGTGSTVNTDAKLKKLEEDADKTGDRSKLIAYRKQLKLK